MLAHRMDVVVVLEYGKPPRALDLRSADVLNAIAWQCHSDRNGSEPQGQQGRRQGEIQDFDSMPSQ
jgi:hypothetical protein